MAKKPMDLATFANNLSILLAVFVAAFSLMAAISQGTGRLAEPAYSGLAQWIVAMAFTPAALALAYGIITQRDVVLFAGLGTYALLSFLFMGGIGRPHLELGLIFLLIAAFLALGARSARGAEESETAP
jgi:hypothetical protein